MPARRQEIGVLLVHGMGEQKPLDHLRSSAKELASFISAAPGLVKLNVIDDVAASGSIVADAVFNYSGGEERVRLHLHEVFWADLGIRGGLGEQVRFWLWGLGQWAAGVVRTGNPRRNTMKLMAMPRFPYQQQAADVPGFWRRVPSRLLLMAAGLLAVLTFFSWSAAKRVVSLLRQRLPEPSLIFLFLGDVKIYEEPGGAGKGSMLDPDQPIRTTIRRRVVSAIARMATDENYDRWYLFAHSLGTVPAFNALQETELALPNYLTRAEWDALPPRFKTARPFAPKGRKPRTERMMPRRPPWLGPTAGIDRRRLFARFAGFVTYGSPLDKFAALWPRVVPLNLQAGVFPAGCEWINLYDPTDPVAARIDAFAAPLDRADPDARAATLEPKSFASRASLVFGLAHIRYFRPRGRRTRSLLRAWQVRRRRRRPQLPKPGPRPNVMPAAVAEAILSCGRTSLAVAAGRASMGTAAIWVRRVLVVIQVFALAILLAAVAAALLYVIGRALPAGITGPLKAAIGAVSADLLATLRAGGPRAVIACVPIVLALAAAAVLLSGGVRIVTDWCYRMRSNPRFRR